MGFNLFLNLSIHTCLLLSHVQNTNVTNVSANQSLRTTSVSLLWWLKGQKPLRLYVGLAPWTGPRSGTLPPVSGNKGFAPMLSASYWKRVCQQALCPVPLTDLTCVCWGRNPTWQPMYLTAGYQREYERFTHDHMLKEKVACEMFEDETLPYHPYPFVIFAQVKVMTPLGLLSSPVFMGCWTEARKKRTRVRI